MRKKQLYVVGYDGDEYCIFGNGGDDLIDPLSANEAKELFEEYRENDAVIYKLVKVDPKKI